MEARKYWLRGGDDPPEEGDVRFRLTYEGPLLSTQRDQAFTGQQSANLVDTKKEMRIVFHRQLKELWQKTPFLAQRRQGIGKHVPVEAARKLPGFWDDPTSPSLPYDQMLGQRYAINGFNYAPLVFPGYFLNCSLSILFLRMDDKMALISAGDVDNRIKTLIDALQIPKRLEEKPRSAPDADESPFYCLLEDDRVVNQLSVETDQLLGISSTKKGPLDNSLVNLVVTVDVRPYHIDQSNHAFL